MKRGHAARKCTAKVQIIYNIHENVYNAIWYKLAANDAINGVSALLETPNGFIAKNQYANELAKMLIKEAITVANASGCTLQYEEVLEHAFDVSRKTDGEPLRLSLFVLASLDICDRILYRC